jgi:hypothetical protein
MAISSSCTDWTSLFLDSGPTCPTASWVSPLECSIGTWNSLCLCYIASPPLSIPWLKSTIIHLRAKSPGSSRDSLPLTLSPLNASVSPLLCESGPNSCHHPKAISVLDCVTAYPIAQAASSGLSESQVFHSFELLSLTLPSFKLFKTRGLWLFLATSPFCSPCAAPNKPHWAACSSSELHVVVSHLPFPHPKANFPCASLTPTRSTQTFLPAWIPSTLQYP